MEDLRDGNTPIIPPDHIQALRLHRGRFLEEEAFLDLRKGWTEGKGSQMSSTHSEITKEEQGPRARTNTKRI